MAARVSAVLVALLLSTMSNTAFAGQFKVLHAFSGYPDGDTPLSTPVMDKQGNLWGTTVYGGNAVGYGTVFKVASDGTETIVHVFSWSANDGANPGAGLVKDAAGNFYGTTQYGGANEFGTIYKIAPGGTFTLLYSLGIQADGGEPLGNLILGPKGNLYGTTLWGSIFKFTPTGTFKVLYYFSGGNDGQYPWSGLAMDANRNLYGSTQWGGPDGDGTVWRVGPKGKFTLLHGFAGGKDGAEIFSNLILDAAGNVYGTAAEGSDSGCFLTGCGLVFKVAPDGTETILHRFKGRNDGGNPIGGLVIDTQGNLYGMTNPGGGCCGAIFEISAAGAYSVVHLFNCATEGCFPQSTAGLLLDSSGNFFGTLSGGGSTNCGCGTLFEYTP